MFEVKKALAKLDSMKIFGHLRINWFREILEAGHSEEVEQPQQYREWVSKQINEQNRKINAIEQRLSRLKSEKVDYEYIHNFEDNVSKSLSALNERLARLEIHCHAHGDDGNVYLIPSKAVRKDHNPQTGKMVEKPVTEKKIFYCIYCSYVSTADEPSEYPKSESARDADDAFDKANNPSECEPMCPYCQGTGIDKECRIRNHISIPKDVAEELYSQK